MSLTYSAEHEFINLQKQLAARHGVETSARTFSVSPSLEQTLVEQITHSVDFLETVNHYFVRDMIGEKVMSGVTGPVSTRTDTTEPGKKRAVRDMLSLKGRTYKLNKIDCDVYIRYATLNAWSKFQNFDAMFMSNVNKQVALDTICVAWNGKKAAKHTDIENNPLLQDLAPGWIADVRRTHPEQIMDVHPDTKKKYTIGKAGDFKNLDELVASLFSMIENTVKGQGDYVCLVGDELIADDSCRSYRDSSATPTEKRVIPESLETYGGLPRVYSPYFPVTGVVVCRLEDLSIYTQGESWRKLLKDNPEYDRVEAWNSRNEGYFVETPEGFAAAPDLVIKHTETP